MGYDIHAFSDARDAGGSTGGCDGGDVLAITGSSGVLLGDQETMDHDVVAAIGRQYTACVPLVTAAGYWRLDLHIVT